MSERSVVCTKCGGKTEEGFIQDCSHTMALVAQWIKGKPEKTFFGATKTEGKRHLEVVTYRCDDCGFLEHYAPGR